MHIKISTKQQDESNLWKKVLKGNKQALASLFHLYHQVLFHYGCRIVPKEDFIEDCIQELFLTIWENHGVISDAKSVKAYLFISMRRMIFKNLRQQRNQKNRNFKYVEEREKLTFSIEEFLIKIEYRNEYQQKLQKALKSLSKRRREVIYLKFYDGMSNSEIANIMNIKSQSVYNHVSEAVNELQQFVK